jgi:hypothetical protein
MKNSIYTFLILISMYLLMVGDSFPADIRSASVKGIWDQPSTWIDGVIPGANDDVTIVNGDTVTLNGARVTCVCNNLTIGEGVSGRLRFITSDTVNMVVFGNITISANASFTVNSNSILGSTGVPHTLDLKGNLTNNGILDFRTGTSGSTLSVCNLTLSGSTNSILNVPYVSSTNGEFNFITINKTSGAKVILASDIVTAGGSSTGPSVCNSGINFISGIVETGIHKLAYQGTTAARVSGYSILSYVNGNFARGISSSAGGSKEFPVGDSSGYRPMYVRSTTSGSATGHLVIVKCVSGNANTGTSVLSGGIDKVSTVRFYQITYSNAIGGAASMSFDLFKPSYGADDGVAAGNTDLRVAYSTDSRATWNGLGQTIPHTTAPPSQIAPDSLAPVVTLASGSSLCITIARATGTTTNTLEGSGLAVEENNDVPAGYTLSQNPFNPATTIKYKVAKDGFVSIKVYNVLGMEVATLVNQKLNTGSYTAVWNAKGFSSGVYFYKMRSDNFLETKSMFMIK